MHELTVITITAASIGLFHTLLGPDHYLPFIVMARARKWSLAKTTCITALCGAGHVLSSIVLGIIGIALGITINKLGAIESFRGGIAAWLLIAFGTGYFVWGYSGRERGGHTYTGMLMGMPVCRYTNIHIVKTIYIFIRGERQRILLPGYSLQSLYSGLVNP